MFGFFRGRRRRKILASPFPEEWKRVLWQNVGWYRLLRAEEQNKLERDMRVFLAERNWEGCAGLELSDSMKVTIAGQACLLILGWDDFLFERVRSILVYPGGYRSRESRAFGSDLPSDRIGEAHQAGTVVLSWRDSLWDARGARDGRNVVLHEFAHILDMENGDADGVPYLPKAREFNEWQAIITREWESLQRALDARRSTLFDPYGSTNLAEFFAVATEAFFELAPHVKREHPDLYRLFRDYYRQDPAARFEVDT